MQAPANGVVLEPPSPPQAGPPSAIPYRVRSDESAEVQQPATTNLGSATITACVAQPRNPSRDSVLDRALLGL